MEDVLDQVLVVWKAPMRPFKKRSVTLMRFFLALVFLVSILIFFIGDLITLLPVWALLFLFYVFAITPPPIVESKLTKFGVETNGVLLRWEVLSHYYFIDRFGYRVLVLVTHGPYYAHSYLVVPDDDTKRRIVEVLNKHLMYLSKPPRTLTDHIIEIFSKLVPEDTPDLPVISNGPFSVPNKNPVSNV